MRRRNPILLAALALAVAACEPAPEPGADEPAAGTETQEQDGPIALVPINRSGVTGFLHLERDDDEMEIRVDVEGLQPGQPYAVDLHDGRCAADGALVLPLGEAVGSQQGVGRVDREIPVEQLEPGRALFLQVTEADGQVVACADLDGSTVSPLTERDTAAERAARDLRARESLEKH